MIYLTDIVLGAPDPAVRDAWVAETQALSGRLGPCAAELFEISEDIRDAHYAYVGLRAWAADPDLEDALAGGALDGSVAGRPVERVVLRLRTQLGAPAPTAPGTVWLVNPFEIAGAEIAGALAMWDRAKDHMEAHAGFVNARLFRARSPHARYGLLNVSQWRSAADFKAALGDRAYDRHRARSLAYRLHPSLCRRVVAPVDGPPGVAGPAAAGLVAAD
ncbi:antibiotic biosynthesis monooxygenase family protein [Roseospira goensis]|uniref:Heme-degrading monooxygenase HmoA n=1 Tax=Roseospira goensis TaxID=391922 RepID=A0A7W6RYP5_9PROT|nr:hypothetical protein [Roseospira goensis]MBB4285696.1 heme-degrading monooxygenase HmoA [Roseospira goensis]